MPCMGPPTPTNKEIEKAYLRILRCIKDELGLLQDPPLNPEYTSGRAEVLAKLKQTIKEILRQDSYETF